MLRDYPEEYDEEEDFSDEEVEEFLATDQDYDYWGDCASDAYEDKFLGE